MRECLNLVFHAQVVVEGITVKVAKFRSVPLKIKVSKGPSNIACDNSSFFGSHEALETLYEKHYISVLNVFAYRDYLTLSIYPIKMRIEIAKIYLIPLFGSL